MAILFSILGLIPFILCGLGALGADAGTASRMLSALIGYAAVALAFTGGIHGGFALQAQQTESGVGRMRLGLAVIPPLIGWVALLLPLVVASWVALVMLIAGYIATILLEHEATRRGLLQSRYIWMRWVYTGVAVAMLITVLTLHLLGQTIVLF